AVRNAIAAGKHRKLWVLLPASTGQRSLSSPWQGGSGFAIHFARGMRGAADTSPFGDDNGEVSLDELSRYLKTQVDQWAFSVFGMRQTPILFSSSSQVSQDDPNTRAVALAWTGTVSDMLPETRYLPQNDSWLAMRWRNINALRTVSIVDRPVRWAHYESLLMRAEQLRRGGRISIKKQGEIDALVEQNESILRTPPTALFALTDRILAKATIKSDLSNTQTFIPLDSSLVETLQDPSKTIPSPPSDHEAWQDNATKSWRWLISYLENKDIDRQTLERWSQLVGTSPSGQYFTPSQVQFVHMLIQWSDQKDWTSSTETFSDLIRGISDSRELAMGWPILLDRSPARNSRIRSSDALLRQAIDYVFAGGTDALTQSKSAVKKVLSNYKDIKADLSFRSNCLNTLHRLQAELPYLLQWWSLEQQSTVSTRSDPILEERTIQDLVNSTRNYYRTFELLASITDPAEREATDLLQVIASQRDSTAALFDRLKGAYLEHCRELSQQKAYSPTTLGGLRRALTIPIVSGDLRIAMLRRADALEKRFTSQFGNAPDRQAEPLPQLDPRRFRSGNITIADSSYHPLSAVLLSNLPDVQKGNNSQRELAISLGQQASALRLAARSMPEYLASIRREANTLERPSQSENNEYLSQFEQAINLTHQQAPLICNRSLSFTASPLTIGFYATAYRRRMLKLTELFLDDFWASLKEKDTPYSLEKAHRILEAADYVSRSYDVHLDDLEQRKLQDRITALDSSVESYASVSISPSRIILAPKTAGDASPTSVVLSTRTGVPQGIASMWLAASIDDAPLEAFNTASSTKTLSKLPLDLSTKNQKTLWSLSKQVSNLLEENRTPALDLVVWFRGHRIAKGLPVVPSTDSRTTNWLPHISTPTQVTVNGDVSQLRSVAIIFDCSGSMGQQMADGRSRLDAGRSAVSKFLGALSTAGEWDVSLWLYGHRTRWSRDERGQFSFSLTKLGEQAKTSAKAKEEPFNLVPGDDVEQVLPMQPLTPGVALEIETLLKPLEAGGETPLYRSISEAVTTDFDGPHRDIPGHVLVVTDGANDQSGGQIVTAQGLEDVLAQKNRRRPSPIRVDIIGFALEADAMTRAIRMGQARDVAISSGGRFYEAADPEALIASLRKSLQPLTWTIRGSRVSTKTFALHDSATLPKALPKHPTPYDIILQAGPRQPQRKVLAENNMALQLYVAGGGRSLECRRYAGGTEQGIRDSRSNLLNPNDSQQRIFIGAHLASRIGDTVRIPLSVQNNDAAQYSRKPTNIWIEVQPLQNGTPSGIPYVIYDLLLQENRPVPVLDLVASSWPQDANTAHIRGWFRFDDIEPDLTIPIHTLPTGIEKDLAFPGLAESKILVTKRTAKDPNQIELSVVEYHPSTFTSNLPLLKLEISDSCLEATHIVEADTGRIRHRFFIKASDGEVSPSTNLLITDKQRITTGAVNTASTGEPPLVVPIPKS
ncbi:MAG: hypothetical protein ABGW78_09215, partial [Pirellulales bacterium]